MALDTESTFRCTCCGEEHEGPPLSYAFEAPIYWYAVPEEERERRVQLGPERCILDGEYFFIKGCLDVPLVDWPGQVFRWVVWVSLSREHYERTLELWERPERVSEPPYFGWLSTRIAGYPDTVNLKTNVHMRPVGERPQIELEPTDHPLAVEQREGITLARVQAIAEQMLHG